tara:strand:- start:31 stop:1014 length:984 start_codon:yes stop_codon:yes gene_type:complete
MNNYNIHDFNLSSTKIDEINNWLKTKDFKKSLIITGKIGTGKTTLVNIILKNYTKITISNYEEDILYKIDSILSKKDISMMFDKKKQYKSLIFDNIIMNSVKVIPLITKKFHSNIPVIYISDVFHKKYSTYIKNYIHVEINKHVEYNNDLFINNSIDITTSLKKYDMKFLFKLLVNDYNVVMFNILEYIQNKIELKLLQKIYHSCILYDNYESFKTTHNIFECKYSILYSVIIPLYYCSHISLNNVKYNSYISRSIIYTQMKNLYTINNYEMYIIILYLYVYHKHNHIYKFNKLNSKIISHYIKLYNLIYGNNLKAINLKKIINKFE